MIKTLAIAATFKQWQFVFLLIAGLGLASAAQASSSGRLLATGGAMMTEGTAGGGVVPWAMLAGYSDEQEWGGTAWLSGVKPKDYTLNAFGAAVSWSNRVELSIGKQSMDIDSVIPGELLDQNIFGIKTRLYGDLVYTRVPQISVGLLYKQNDSFDVPNLVGAEDGHGVDFYLAASKLWLDGFFDRSVFFNATFRATKANQMGLLGFGGDLNNSYDIVGEFSGGVFINRHWVIGAEYRQKPNNLSSFVENDWQDVFVGWFPNKRVAVVAAWATLGSIAGLDNQDSFYLSLQLSH